MANTQMRRGVPETLGLAGANGLSVGGSLSNGQNSATFAVAIEAAMARMSFEVFYTGGPTTVAVPIQCSNDGTNWANLKTYSTAPGSFTNGATADGSVEILTAFAFVRVGPTTLTGGISPTVTVIARHQ